jgi:hypothetical protein
MGDAAARRKPVFKSPSMTFGQYDKIKSKCTRCGGMGHNPTECPLAEYNLLAPSSYITSYLKPVNRIRLLDMCSHQFGWRLLIMLLQGLQQ